MAQSWSVINTCAGGRRPGDRHWTAPVTGFREFPGRTHYTPGQDGWEEVADFALEWSAQR